MLFSESDYRKALRNLIKQHKATGRRLTLRGLASRLKIQHTYLSKVLKPQSSVHLSEDALSELCSHLELSLEEEEFILLLRSKETSQSPQRKKRIQEKLEQIRNANKLDVPILEGSRLALEKETQFLLNPFAVLTHVALNVEKFKERPMDLATEFGIDPTELRRILDELEDTGLIEFDSQRRKVKALHQRKKHLGTQHPLMRSHQMQLRSAALGRLMQLSDEQKKSFTVSFTGAKESYQKIIDAFDKFLAEVREISVNSKNESVYQLNFDLFDWTE